MSQTTKKQRRSGFRLDVAVNGKPVCRAGSGRYGVLSLALTWVRHDPKKRPHLKTAEKWAREECSLRFGALTGEFQEAWETLPLKEGDEITVRVLGPGASDVPASRSRSLAPASAKIKSPKIMEDDDHEAGMRVADFDADPNGSDPKR